jgi:Uma2 family endonuclease
MAQPQRAATYADLERVPPHLVAELIEGELVTHPRPAPRHAVASGALLGELTGPFQKGRGGPNGWIFANEPELHLGRHVIVPDLAGWRRERLPAYPDSAYFTLAPDWVCEVLSPSTSRMDRGVKRAIYARAGVQHLWLLDPAERVLEAFSLTNDTWLLAGVATGNDAISLAPFEAITFPMGVLFPLDPPFQEDAPTEG